MRVEQLVLIGHIAFSASAHCVIDLANVFRTYGPRVGLDKPRQIYRPAQDLYVSAGICYRPGYRILYLGQPKKRQSLVAVSALAHLHIDLAIAFQAYGPHLGLDKPREIYLPAQISYVSAWTCYRPGYRILYANLNRHTARPTLHMI